MTPCPVLRTGPARGSRSGRRSSRALAVLVVGAIAVSLAGCASSPAGDRATRAPDATSAADEPRTLTVFAAASLTATFTELAKRFEASHDGVEVTLSFAGSSDSVTQLENGAPADVFASADEANMTRLVEANLAAGDPQTFATNTLTIVTPSGNPAGVKSLNDLAAPGLRLVVCAPQVPCGAAAESVFALSGITPVPVSEESSVTDVLGKVSSGEADAGLVYRTDAVGSAGAIDEVSDPRAADVVNAYQIVALTETTDHALADAFIALVRGEEGRATLAEAGFRCGGDDC